MVDEDWQYVEKSLLGSTQAFERLVDKYEKPIYNLAFRMASDRDDAADITQNVFTRAFENLRQFDRKFRFFSWLYRIGINESLNFIAKRRGCEELNDDVVSGEKSPEEVCRDSELSDKIQDGLMRLKLDHRVVIVLSHFQDLSYREIAYVLGLPEKTVKSRLFSARNELREVLLRKGVFDA